MIVLLLFIQLMTLRCGLIEISYYLLVEVVAVSESALFGALRLTCIEADARGK